MNEKDKEITRLADTLFDMVFKRKPLEPKPVEPKLYCTRPVYVVAIQYNGHLDSLVDFVGANKVFMERKKNFIAGTYSDELFVTTVVGHERVVVGDYVAKQPNGDILMASAADFEKVFQPK